MSDLIGTEQPECTNCDSSGWVCENHPETPWNEGEGCCGGAGGPCAVCNPCDRETPPRMVAGSTVIYDAAHGWRH